MKRLGKALARAWFRTAGRLRRNWLIMTWHGTVPPKPPPIPVLLVVGYMLAGAVAAGLVMLFADARIMSAVAHQPDWSRAIFGWITHAGKSDWVLIPSALVALVIALGDWRYVGRRSAAAWAEIAAFASVVFMAVGAAGLFNNLLKFLFGRLRPPYADGNIHAFEPLTFGYEFASFPSGHATVAGALAAIMIAGPYGWRAVGLGVLVVVACSRFMINVHYPSDVTAGFLCGAGVSFLIVRAMAYGGFGFTRDRQGRIVWRFSILRRQARSRGWLSDLWPAFWVALLRR